MARTLNQILAQEKPEVVAEAQERANDILLTIHLSEIRNCMAKTQKEIADALGVKQPTIAGMERLGQDIKLSSLKRYVEAGGGKVSLDVEMPDGKHQAFPL